MARRWNKVPEWMLSILFFSPPDVLVQWIFFIFLVVVGFGRLLSVRTRERPWTLVSLWTRGRPWTLVSVALRFSKH